MHKQGRRKTRWANLKKLHVAQKIELSKISAAILNIAIIYKSHQHENVSCKNYIWSPKISVVGQPQVNVGGKRVIWQSRTPCKDHKWIVIRKNKILISLSHTYTSAKKFTGRSKIFCSNCLAERVWGGNGEETYKGIQRIFNWEIYIIMNFT